MDTKLLRQWKKYRQEIEDYNKEHWGTTYFDPKKAKWEDFLDWVTENDVSKTNKEN